MKRKFLCIVLALSIIATTFVLCGANFDLSDLETESICRKRESHSYVNKVCTLCGKKKLL